VLVEVGDSVEEGQALVELDISEWEEQIEVLESSLIAAERKLDTEKLDLIQAQINLQTAESNLDAIEEVQEVRDAIEDTEYDLEIAQVMLQHATVSGSSWDVLNYWRNLVSYYETRLAQAQQELAEVLTNPDNQGAGTTEVTVKQLQFELAQMRLEEAQNSVADAEQAITDAQQALDEAKATSLVISAPFAGLITGVNVSLGDVVKEGSVVLILADTTEFEAAVMVGEMDILQVSLGGEAWVQVDAMQGMSLPAKVTHISPTATIQQGVVNYSVKVEIESLQAVRQERQAAGQEAMQEAMESIAQGEMPERLKQAIEEGRMTQEQAEEMMERMQRGLGGQQGPGGQQGLGGQQGQVPTAIIEDFQLREGLTVTVSIIVDERNDVLLVPNSAITSQGGQSYVQVVLPDGTMEERLVTTGLSDWQVTEITDGLSEGEQVLVPQGSTTTTTTPQQGGRIPFFPGGGRPR
jgi:multidrug efflux pump subunit AcrA (membrane-fusion protein)